MSNYNYRPYSTPAILSTPSLTWNATDALPTPSDDDAYLKCEYEFPLKLPDDPFLNAVPRDVISPALPQSEKSRGKKSQRSQSQGVVDAVLSGTGSYGGASEGTSMQRVRGGKLSSVVPSDTTPFQVSQEQLGAVAATTYGSPSLALSASSVPQTLSSSVPFDASTHHFLSPLPITAYWDLETGEPIHLSGEQEWMDEMGDARERERELEMNTAAKNRPELEISVDWTPVVLPPPSPTTAMLFEFCGNATDQEMQLFYLNTVQNAKEGPVEETTHAVKHVKAPELRYPSSNPYPTFDPSVGPLLPAARVVASSSRIAPFSSSFSGPQHSAVLPALDPTPSYYPSSPDKLTPSAPPTKKPRTSERPSTPSSLQATAVVAPPLLQTSPSPPLFRPWATTNLLFSSDSSPFDLSPTLIPLGFTYSTTWTAYTRIHFYLSLSLPLSNKDLFLGTDSKCRVANFRATLSAASSTQPGAVSLKTIPNGKRVTNFPLGDFVDVEPLRLDLPTSSGGPRTVSNVTAQFVHLRFPHATRKKPKQELVTLALVLDAMDEQGHGVEVGRFESEGVQVLSGVKADHTEEAKNKRLGWREARREKTKAAAVGSTEGDEEGE